MPGKVRRIVTGHNAAGKSIIVSDTLLPPGDLAPGERVRAAIWGTDRMPVSNAGNDDTVPGFVATQIPPVRGGTSFRILDVPPDTGEGHPEEMRARGAQVDSERTAKHPGFHNTDTLDYAICLEGEVWAVMDEGETLMKAGDILIQRGTYHAWSNRSNQMCRIAFILIDADPV